MRPPAAGAAAIARWIRYTATGGARANVAELSVTGQHIGGSDALRTGAYSKTLVFTLATTQP